ncbi:MAG TPA: VWA domain-containing protein [Armatimonadetes bacterium]|nr:VWA domain-containing protein [Armatimonadota bacterium]
MHIVFAGWLLALPILIIVIGIAWYRWHRHADSAVRYPSIALIKTAIGMKSRWYERLLWFMRLLALLLAILALARPQLLSRHEVTTSKGIDIMLALDASGSMRAEDFSPRNRLEMAKDVIRDFVHGLKTDRVGLVVFAAESYTQCPLTTDYDLLLTLLEEVSFGVVRDGTAIGLGIMNCLNRLKRSKAKSKVIILLTDGVNNIELIDPLTAAEAARVLGVRIYTVGVGRPEGGIIPLDDPLFGRRLLTPGGRATLRARLDEATLKEIARITNGAYYRANDPQTLAAIYHQIWRLEKSRLKVKWRTQRAEVFGYALMLAMLVLICEIMLTTTLWRKLP